MEAWQVFDASTAELLAQLDLLGSPSSDASRYDFPPHERPNRMIVFAQGHILERAAS